MRRKHLHFNASIDNGVVLAEENSKDAKLCKVRYASLIMILLMDTNELTEHDQYVCHDSRNPFKYRVPGYSAAEIRRNSVNVKKQELPEMKRRRSCGTLAWQNKHGQKSAARCTIVKSRQLKS